MSATDDASTRPRIDSWPSLPLNEWKDTCQTLHMWTQVVGKIRLALSPTQPHWWQVPLYLTSRGLTTSPIAQGGRTFEISFDFVDHNLLVQTSEGATRALPLVPRSVADFYGEVMGILGSLDINVSIWTTPVEIPDPIPFEQDTTHASYDPEYANRFWRVLLQTDDVFKEFRGRFLGKSSPVHFFWGSCDLALTRFSGRRAPEREGADPITREAYSHEVISCGFWPGSGDVKDAAYYCYAAPAPPGLEQEKVRPGAAYYDQKLGEFLLMYDEVRRSESPRQMLLDFAQSTYEAGARLANWDREELDRDWRASAR
jgi:hypothetical protein